MILWYMKLQKNRVHTLAVSTSLDEVNYESFTYSEKEYYILSLL